MITQFKRKHIWLFVLLAAMLIAAQAAAVSSAVGRAPSTSQISGAWTSFSTSDGLGSDSIIALDMVANGYLWVGTNQGASVHGPEGDWLILDGLGDASVMDVAPDPSDAQRHWFATYGGGVLLDDGGNPLDKAGHTWINFDKGDGLVEKYVSAVAVDADSNIWFGTNFIDDQGGETGYGISMLDVNDTPFTKTDDIWTTYTAANSNLSHNVIHDIAVDSQGVVWIATKSGLNAYSGGNWTVYYTSDGLPSNNVTALLAVNDLLWVGSKGGISVLDYNGTPHDKTDDQWGSFTQYNSGLTDNDTSSLAIDGAGRIWVGTDQKSNSGEVGYGVSVLDANNTLFDRNDDTWATFKTTSGLAHNAVRAVAAGDSGAAWFGTKEGLSYLDYGSSPYNSSDDQWTTYKAGDRLAGNSVYAAAKAGSEAVWLGTDQGLSLLQYQSTPHTKPDDRWTTYTTADGLAANGIRTLTTDSQGRLWVGTGAGLTILDTRGTLTYKGDDISITYKSSSGLVHDQINDIVIDDAGRAWIACGSYFGGGLHVLDVGGSLSSRSDDTWATFTPLNSGLPNPYVTAVALADSNNVWLGTQGGAARLNHAGSPFDKTDDSWTTFTTANSGLAYDTIRDVAIDKAGNIWFGLAIEGVSVYSTGGTWVTFTQSDGLAYDSVDAVAVDQSGNLWLGTDGGGVSVLNYAGTLNDKSDDAWTTYAGGQELLSGNIRAIAEDEREQIWLGTFGGGASVYALLKIYLPVILNNVQ